MLLAEFVSMSSHRPCTVHLPTWSCVVTRFEWAWQHFLLSVLTKVSCWERETRVTSLSSATKCWTVDSCKTTKPEAKSALFRYEIMGNQCNSFRLRLAKTSLFFDCRSPKRAAFSSIGQTQTTHFAFVLKQEKICNIGSGLHFVLEFSTISLNYNKTIDLRQIFNDKITGMNGPISSMLRVDSLWMFSSWSKSTDSIHFLIPFRSI